MLPDISQYRLVTGDTSTAASSVSAALLESQELIEELLDRELESAERTETVYVRRRGYVYPRAVPVTAIAAGSATQGTIEHRGFAVRATSAPSVLAAWPGDPPTRVYDDEAIDPTEVALTYTGGYTNANLPIGLKRGLYVLARGLIEFAARGGSPVLPPGATSVSLDGASVSYAAPVGARGGAAGIIDDLVPGLAGKLGAYARPEP